MNTLTFVSKTLLSVRPHINMVRMCTYSTKGINKPDGVNIEYLEGSSTVKKFKPTKIPKVEFTRSKPPTSDGNDFTFEIKFGKGKKSSIDDNQTDILVIAMMLGFVLIFTKMLFSAAK